MQYLISQINIESFGTLSVIKNPHNINIKPMLWYKNTNPKNYDAAVSEKKLIVEPDFELKYFAQFENKHCMFMAYNYYYLQLLYEMIHKGYLTYKWLDLNSNHFDNHSMSQQIFKEEKNNNGFLNDFDKKLETLALDILKNGMYFPLGYRSLRNNFIQLGRHRFCSLNSIRDQLNNKKFLFLDFSQFDRIWQGIPYTSLPLLMEPVCQQTIPCFWVSEDGKGIFRTYQNRYLLTWNYFRNFSDVLGGRMFYHQDFIKPNPVFNSEKAWEEFINKPFPYQTNLEDFM